MSLTRTETRVDIITDSLIEIHQLAIDADGCVYNVKYTRLMVFIINQYWDFIQENLTQKIPNEEAAVKIKATISDMIKEIESFQFEEKPKPNAFYKMLQYINNENFLKGVKKASKHFSLHCPSYSKEKNEQAAILAVVASFIQLLRKNNKWGSELLKAIFIKANESLITHFCGLCESNNIQYIGVALSTNRQSDFHNQLGMDQNGTNCIYDDGLNLRAEMERLLKISVMMNMFSMTDIYAQLEHSTNFQTIIKASQNKSAFKNFKHPLAIYDENKISLFYALSHNSVIEFAKDEKFKNKKFVLRMRVVDDYLRILLSLYYIFTLYPTLLPDNVIIDFCQYIGQDKLKVLFSVKGTGPVDYYYRKNIFMMAKMCGHTLEDLTKTIDVATQLHFEEFLQKRVTGNEIVPYISPSFKRIKKGHITAQESQAIAPTTVQAKPRKILGVIPSAAGCIYNDVYLSLLTYIVAKHGKFIRKYAYNEELIEEDKELIEKKIEAILVEMKGLTNPTIFTASIQNIDLDALTSEILLNAGFDFKYFAPEKINLYSKEIIDQHVKHIKNLGVYGDLLFKELLFLSNISLLATILDIFKELSCDDFFLLPGSEGQFNYQDRQSDEAIIDLFTDDLQRLSKILDEIFSQEKEVKCAVDEFSLEQLLNDNQSSINQNLFAWCFSMLQHVVKKYPNDEITLIVLQNDNEKFNDLLNIFIHHFDLIPKNISLECWPYNGTLPTNQIVLPITETDNPFKREDDEYNEVMEDNDSVVVIHGTGEGYDKFPEYTKLLMQLCGSNFDSEIKIDPNDLPDWVIKLFKKKMASSSPKIKSNLVADFSVFEKTANQATSLADENTIQNTAQSAQSRHTM